MQSAQLCHSRDGEPGSNMCKVRKVACLQEPKNKCSLYHDELSLAHFTCVIVKFVKVIVADYDIYVCNRALMCVPRAPTDVPVCVFQIIPIYV